MRFSDVLRTRTDDVWKQMFGHPFLTGLSDSTLPIEKFEYYIRQDYLYLIEYSRARALAVAKAPPGSTMGKLAELLNSVLNGEMSLHRKLTARRGLTEADLANSQVAPTCHAYTRHLLAVAYAGSVTEYLAAIMPCAWGYREIGHLLAARTLPAEPLYTDWIRFYASDDYHNVVSWMRDKLDELAERCGTDELERMQQHYTTSARYEWMFWEMAFRQEQWPV